MDQTQWFQNKSYSSNSGRNYSSSNSANHTYVNWNQRSWNSSYNGTHNSNYDSQNPKARVIYVNDQIKASTIMIIDDDKKNLWVFSRRVALEMAEQAWLDLVQISYDPEKMQSTVKMTDYWKYMYQKWKEDKERKKQQKSHETKEIKLSYAIWDNDLALKLKKAEEFLTSWTSVKISIKLKWREKMYADKALEKIQYAKDQLSQFGRAQYDTPKKEAQWYSIILFAK